MLSKRQRPKIDEYPEYLFGVLHFPVYDKTIQRLNAAELDVFLGADYLVTLPNVELLPVARLFHRLEEDERLRDELFAKGSGRLLYEVLDDLFDYCFPILDKIGHKLDSVEDDMFERRAEDVVRDLSNVKQEIISYRKIIKPERTTLRVLERRVERFLPEELDLYFDDIVDARRADLGPARQLQGGRRGARVDERVGDLAPAERRPPRPDRLQRDAAAADAARERLRDERRLPGLRHGGRVLGDRRRDGRGRRRPARLLPLEALDLSAMVRATVVVVLVAAGTLGRAEAGRASISIAKNAVQPAVRIDARGNAEVSWSSGGVRRTLLVPAVGLYLPGGRISTADVSRPTTITGLPFARATRRGPDGTLYALQTWRVEPTGPVELHFSRWKGARTTVDPGRRIRMAGSRTSLPRSERSSGKPLAGTARTGSIAASPCATTA